MIARSIRLRFVPASSFEIGPSSPVRRIVYTLMYGFASGATLRTSIRADFSLPSGIRTIAPRSIADALI